MAEIPKINSTDDAVALSYGTAGAQNYNRNRVQFGDGQSQRKARGINNAPQRWQLVWTRISDEDAETLRLFFEDLAGVGVVDWKPYAQPAMLKWTATGWQNKPSGFQVQDCSINLEQEFDL
jgi:phage-related protein